VENRNPQEDCLRYRLIRGPFVLLKHLEKKNISDEDFVVFWTLGYLALTAELTHLFQREAWAQEQQLSSGQSV